jgi:leucyl-tRNA synthetase
MSIERASGGRTTNDGHAVERKWQARWRQESCFVGGARAERPRQFHYPAGPFTNGRLHLGHVRTFTLADVMARAARQQGYDVLYIFEFDAFGLPTELAARQQGVSPASLARDHAARMRSDLERLGVSVDWDRVRLTCDPRYYRWTQWLFLRMFERGLIERGTAMLNYCTTCETVLAHLEVERGACWRCHSPVERREMTQWFVRLSDASRRLLDTLPELTGWSDTLRRLLSGFIGAVEGTEIDVDVALPDGSSVTLTAFVPHETIGEQADAVLIAPGRADLARLLRRGASTDAAELPATAALRRRRREDIAGGEIVETGLVATNAAWPAPLPVLASTALDPGWATGVTLRAASDDGDGVTWAAAGSGSRPRVHHRVQDWLVSRQRSWGTPIPIVQCPTCGDVPLPEERLPFELDLDERGVRRVPTVACPSCGAEATAEPDTLDCFFDVVWSMTALASSLPEDVDLLFKEAGEWGPVDWFHCGLDSFFYAHLHRFVGHVLHDMGFTAEPEPVRNFHGHAMVKLGGRKMSKHEGNAVDASTLLDELGADLLRVQVLWAANPLQPIEFRPEPDPRAEGLLLSVRSLVLDNVALVRSAEGAEGETAGAPSPAAADARRAVHRAIEKVTRLLEHYRPAAALEEINRLATCMSKLRRALDRGELDASATHVLATGIPVLVQLLGPFAPHLAEELWEALGVGDGLLALGPWPDARSFEDHDHHDREEVRR